MPLFSIIMVHFQGANSHPIFMRGYESLAAQTFKDYEILCYHDGPLLDPAAQFPLPVTCTPQRHNDWGHSLRHAGILAATGDYILHFNADNILYPDALQQIAEAIHRPPRLKDKSGQILDTNDMVIFPIKMWNLVKFRDITWQPKVPPQFYTILTGVPAVAQNIDCMQLVMKRELWLAEGGWYDRRPMSDGCLYEKFAAKYGYRTVGPILGEHF
jgi:Glycosyl transferase family 2